MEKVILSNGQKVGLWIQSIILFIFIPLGMILGENISSDNPCLEEPTTFTIIVLLIAGVGVLRFLLGNIYKTIRRLEK